MRKKMMNDERGVMNEEQLAFHSSFIIHHSAFIISSILSIRVKYFWNYVNPTGVKLSHPVS